VTTFITSHAYNKFHKKIAKKEERCLTKGGKIHKAVQDTRHPGHGSDIKSLAKQQHSTYMYSQHRRLPCSLPYLTPKNEIYYYKNSFPKIYSGPSAPNLRIVGASRKFKPDFDVSSNNFSLEDPDPHTEHDRIQTAYNKVHSGCTDS
jgi:hypothetical protein